MAAALSRPSLCGQPTRASASFSRAESVGKPSHAALASSLRSFPKALAHNPPCRNTLRGPRKTLTVCMAAPKRVAMVSKQIEREIGQMLLTDKVLQSAVCPERKRGMDTYLSAIASVTEVDLSRDMQVAKVYISVYSDEEGKAKAFAGLAKLEGYVRKNIGQRVRLRMTPEIRLIPDESFERSERVLSILKKIQDGTAEPPPIAIPGDDEDFEDFGEDGFGDAEAWDAGSGGRPGGLTDEEIDAFFMASPSGAGTGKPSRNQNSRRKQGSGKSRRRR